MAKYNLDENIGEDYFTFDVKGHEYKMTYPSTRELLDLQALQNEDLATSRESQEKFLDWAIKFTTTDDKTAPDLKETIMGGNFKYTFGFVKMIQKELSNDG